MHSTNESYSIKSPVSAPTTTSFPVFADQAMTAQILSPADVHFEGETAALLGAGGMGIVRKAIYKGVPVAVKSLKLGSNPYKSMRLFVKEAEKMRAIRHNKIVLYYGFLLESFSIVMELLPDGNLAEYIAVNREGFLWSERQTCATVRC